MPSVMVANSPARVCCPRQPGRGSLRRTLAAPGTREAAAEPLAQGTFEGGGA